MKKLTSFQLTCSLVRQLENAKSVKQIRMLNGKFQKHLRNANLSKNLFLSAMREWGRIEENVKLEKA